MVLVGGGLVASSATNSHINPGNFVSIATATVTSGGANSVTFSSIPQTYTHLQVRVFDVYNSAVSRGRIRLNSDTTSSDYQSHYLDGSGSTASGGYENGYTYGIWVSPRVDQNLSNGATVSIIDILDYTNTNKYKTVRALSGFDANGTGDVEFNSGLWLSTSAVNTVSFSNDNSTLTQLSAGTVIALYGVK
jgi:hypothetical protein